VLQVGTRMEDLIGTVDSMAAFAQKVEEFNQQVAAKKQQTAEAPLPPPVGDLRG
jgi:hypothetical protein